MRGDDRALGLGDMSPSPKAVTCHRTPKTHPPLGSILFINNFGKAAYKYFNDFGPWTADVQGPLLNSHVMNVVMTALAPRPVWAPGLPCADATPFRPGPLTRRRSAAPVEPVPCAAGPLSIFRQALKFIRAIRALREEPHSGSIRANPG